MTRSGRLLGSIEADEDDCVCQYTLRMTPEEPDAVDWLIRTLDMLIANGGHNTRRAEVIKETFARLICHNHTLHERCHELELAVTAARGGVN